jgi:hypothetical protein
VRRHQEPFDTEAARECLTKARHVDFTHFANALSDNHTAGTARLRALSREVGAAGRRLRAALRALEKHRAMAFPPSAILPVLDRLRELLEGAISGTESAHSWSVRLLRPTDIDRAVSGLQDRKVRRRRGRPSWQQAFVHLYFARHPRATRRLADWLALDEELHFLPSGERARRRKMKDLLRRAK